MRQLFILYFLIMFACVSIRAQYPQVRNFSTSDYQAGTQNWCFEDGPNQRVFIGNNQGLLTFVTALCQQLFCGEGTALRPVFTASLCRSIRRAGLLRDGPAAHGHHLPLSDKPTAVRQKEHWRSVEYHEQW